MTSTNLPIVGLIPAAGQGSRLGRIPCSKELLPLGFAREADGRLRPKVVCEYLVDQMRLAGCRRIYFILRRGKWDIPAFFGSGSDFGLPFGYLVTNEPWGAPFTLGQAGPFVEDAIVVMGFPDILLNPPQMLAEVVKALQRSPAVDVMLGTLDADAHAGTDLVRVVDGERVQRVEPKEETPDWQDGDRTWAVAAWRPRFSRFLLRHLEVLRERAKEYSGSAQPEWPVGAVIKAAIAQNLDVRARHFENGLHLDVGLPERLARAGEFPGVWDGR